MKIRSFKESDAEKAAKLSNSNSDAFQYCVTADFLRQMSQNPSYKMFVAADANELLGFCGVNFSQLPVAELGPICISDNRRMEGLGRLLLERIFEFLESHKPLTVIIQVKTSNTGAQEFFSSLGFKKTEGVMVNEIPAILMEWNGLS